MKYSVSDPIEGRDKGLNLSMFKNLFLDSKYSNIQITISDIIHKQACRPFQYGCRVKALKSYAEDT